MDSAPLIACRVLRTMHAPIPANPSDMLIAWPGHPTMALSVCSADGLRVLTFRAYPAREIAELLSRLVAEGTLQPLDAGSVQRLTPKR